MKLDEFRKLIDELDDSSIGEYDVMLDIDPNPYNEHLVDIGEIYQSRMHSAQIKIEPKIELDVHRDPVKMSIKTDISGASILRCPRCGRRLASSDQFCRKCGQPIYNKHETREILVEQAKERIAATRELRREKRIEKKASGKSGGIFGKLRRK